MTKIQKIYLFSALIFIVAAYFSVGFYQFDEHTQVMEFAGMKLGLTEKANLSWEYATHMRAGLQPLMVCCAHEMLAPVGFDDPFSVAFALRLFSAALSFLSIHLLIKAFLHKIQGERLQMSFVLLSFLLWFLVFNSVRFSAENLGGRIFVIAFALFYIWKDDSAKKYFVLGTLLGLSFLFRYQNAFLMLGFFAWLGLVHKSKISHLALLVAGIVFLFACGLLVDRWFYGEWVLSTWHYFEQNILMDKMSGFGIEPWYYYFTQIITVGVPPFSLLYILPLLLLVVHQRRNPLVWIALPFLLLHSALGHKELRFLFPMLGFVPLIIVQAGEVINEKWPQIFKYKAYQVAVVLFWIHNGLFLCFVSLKAADSQVNLYQVVYHNYQQQTLFCYTEHNPYSRAMDVHYYKRKNLKVLQIKSLQELSVPRDSVVLFATNNNDEVALVEKNNVLIYTSLPEWVKMFNVFHWVERTHFWRVYEIKKPLPVNK